MAHNKTLAAQLYGEFKDFFPENSVCEKLEDAFDGKMKGYYAMWIERCEFQKTQTLPEDWNGVFIATTK